jgi:hypothetical protein
MEHAASSPELLDQIKVNIYVDKLLIIACTHDMHKCSIYHADVKEQIRLISSLVCMHATYGVCAAFVPAAGRSAARTSS